ncbi:MAG: hypothetical protein K6A37_09090 [Saccharofermentans sp.]|nr:hypothetical protein [Saccharofermentans sp.]
MNGSDDKMNKKMNRILRLTLFCSYYFHFFAPLVLIGVICTVIGFFKHQFFIAAGIVFILDFVLSLMMIIRFSRMQSDNPEYEKFRQAMSGNNPYESLNKLTGEWSGTGEEFFRSRVKMFTEEAENAESVREAFNLYKEHAGSVINNNLMFEFSVSTYVYQDGQNHFVISFDRQREINDDVIVHLWYDLLFDPDTADDSLSENILCENIDEVDDYFAKVEAFLEQNGLMDLPVKKYDIGTDE